MKFDSASISIFQNKTDFDFDTFFFRVWFILLDELKHVLALSSTVGTDSFSSINGNFSWESLMLSMDNELSPTSSSLEY